MKGNDRADRLAGKTTLTSGLPLRRSEMLRSLRYYLRAQFTFRVYKLFHCHTHYSSPSVFTNCSIVIPTTVHLPSLQIVPLSYPLQFAFRLYKLFHCHITKFAFRLYKLFPLHFAFRLYKLFHCHTHYSSPSAVTNYSHYSSPSVFTNCPHYSSPSVSTNCTYYRINAQRS